MKQRYFIRLSYAGTNYNGWQAQENTPNTIQQVLQVMMSQLLQEKIEILGCGRTDTGVHAENYYAHFDSSICDLHADPKLWLYKFNKVLPNDIVIFEIIPVDEKAHARFDATKRTYEYRIHTKKDAFNNNTSCYVPTELSIEAMQKASDYLLTVSDFSSFAKLNAQLKNNNCVVSEAVWKVEGNKLIFTISANRFLRNMVRAIVGTLIEVGRNKISLEEFKTIAEKHNRSDAGFSAVAQGLFLTNIVYPSNILSKHEG